MSKYLHLFSTDNQFQSAYTGEDYKEPWVSYTEEPERVDYNKTEEEKMPITPLTFEILSDGVVAWTFNSTASTSYLPWTVWKMHYKKNGGELQELGTEFPSTTSNATSYTDTISVTRGDVIEFIDTCETSRNGAGGDTYCSHSFSGTTAQFKVKGNIASTIYGDNFSGKESFPGSGKEYQLYGFFKDCVTLVDASMIYINLTGDSAQESYMSMFSGCKNMAHGPKYLPGGRLSTRWYQNMFYGCEKLLEAPEFTSPITCAYTNCCYSMFSGCTSLVKAMPVVGSPNMGSFRKQGNDGYFEKMFAGCTSLEIAPELPWLSVKDNAYVEMFNGCTKLKQVKCLATTLNTNSTTNWLNGVSASGTFMKSASMAGWTSGADGIPNGWTIEDAS